MKEGMGSSRGAKGAWALELAWSLEVCCSHLVAVWHSYLTFLRQRFFTCGLSKIMLLFYDCGVSNVHRDPGAQEEVRGPAVTSLKTHPHVQQ